MRCGYSVWFINCGSFIPRAVVLKRKIWSVSTGLDSYIQQSMMYIVNQSNNLTYYREWFGIMQTTFESSGNACAGKKKKKSCNNTHILLQKGNPRDGHTVIRLNNSPYPWSQKIFPLENAVEFAGSPLCLFLCTPWRSQQIVLEWSSWC